MFYDTHCLKACLEHVSIRRNVLLGGYPMNFIEVEATAFLQPYSLLMKPLLHFGVSPELHHDRGAGVESMNGVIGVFPPPLNFPGVRTLRAF